MKNFYETLGVSQDADDDTLRTAAVSLASKYKSNPTPENQAKFSDIEVAYEVLGTPELRRKYDYQLNIEQEREKTTCRYCGEEILSIAVKCKHCGSDVEVSNDVASNTDENKITPYIILKAVFLVAVVSYFLWNRINPTQQAVDLSSSARGACMEFIKTQLHDPSSAEFFNSSEATVARNPDGTWLVTRSVRAKNGFNATRLFNFECEMRYRDGNWTAENIHQVN